MNNKQRFALFFAVLLFLTPVNAAGHDLPLSLEPDYVEGWNRSSGNAFEQYDVVGGPGARVLTTEFRSDTESTQGALHMRDDGATTTERTVKLNDTNHSIYPSNDGSNITGTTRISGQFTCDGGNGGTGSGCWNGVKWNNSDGEEIRILAKHESAALNMNNPDNGWVIEGAGVETKVVRAKDSLFEAPSDSTDVTGNWTYWIDLSKREVGLKSTNMDSGPLTTTITSGWEDAGDERLEFYYTHRHDDGSSGSDSESWWEFMNITGINIENKYTINGTIKDPAGNPIEGANVTTSTGEDITTGADGFYEFHEFNGTYSITANADGFKEKTTSVTVAGSDVTKNITLETETNLRLDINPYMDHGSTQPYEVWEVFENRSDEDVTDNATVTSSNTTVVVVNQSSEELEATGNIKINDRVSITAVYNNSTVSENVTVSNLTVENIKILPPWRRLAALIGDVDNVGGTQKTFLWLIIVMLASVVATHYTSAFGGLSTGVVLLTFGWVPGWVSTGVVLIGLFTGMFLAFNVAMNIDYTVMRNRP